MFHANRYPQFAHIRFLYSHLIDQYPAAVTMAPEAKKKRSKAEEDDDDCLRSRPESSMSQKVRIYQTGKHFDCQKASDS